MFFFVSINLPCELTSINFIANPAKLTALLSNNEEESRLVARFIGDRPRHGVFGGHIYLSGGKRIAHVTTDAENLYLPGLTYVEMLMYSLRLRIAYDEKDKNSTGSLLDDDFGNSQLLLERSVSTGSAHFSKPPDSLNQRVNDMLELMDLLHCQNNVIPERPSLRGMEGRIDAFM